MRFLIGHCSLKTETADYITRCSNSVDYSIKSPSTIALQIKVKKKKKKDSSS